MKANELVKIVVCFKTKKDTDIARQTVFISKKDFESKKKIPVNLKGKGQVISIQVELVKIELSGEES
jgi:hypothetical protein